MTLADPIRPTAPADAATNVTTATSFAFGTLAGGVQRVTFYATAQPTITVFTKDGTVNLPDLTAFGAALPKSTLYTWRVSGTPRSRRSTTRSSPRRWTRRTARFPRSWTCA